MLDRFFAKMFESQLYFPWFETNTQLIDLISNLDTHRDRLQYFAITLNGAIYELKKYSQ
jgi:hypothetical protein